MRKGSMVYLEQQMGAWKLDDAKAILGEPTRQRDALNGQNVDGIIYAFPDPTNALRELELNFGNKTGRLRAVYGFPYALKLAAAQALWGRDYQVVKNPNGTKSYAYRHRRIVILTDKDGTIISYGVYLQ
jgi:hypothetical protein